jgi:hypothetical protein
MGFRRRYRGPLFLSLIALSPGPAFHCRVRAKVLIVMIHVPLLDGEAYAK